MAALMNRVKGLFASKKATAIATLEPYTVQHEKLDEFILGDMRNHSKRFETMLTTPVEVETKDENGVVTERNTYEQALDLRSDLFFAHHVGSDDVRMEDKADIKPSAQLNAEIMAHFVQHPDFLATRPMTRNDDVGSSLATMAAQGTLDEELKTTLADHAQSATDAAASEDEIERQQQLIDELRQRIADAKANGLPIDPALIQAIKDAIAARNDATKELETIAGTMGGISGKVADAVGAAAANAKELCNVYLSLPGVGIGAGQRVQPQHAIELAYKWRNAKGLKKIAELLGRLERDFRYKRSHRIVGGMDEPIGVEVGNDIRRLLPNEFVTLGHPVLKTKFYRDFAAKQLLQYEMIGHAEAGRGPVIICIDASGSMAGAENEWARAVALATSSIAHREKRSVYIIEFASAVTGEWHLPAKTGIDPEVATDFAMSFNGGGTDITQALKRAKQIFETHPDFRQADILLITDGSDHMGVEDLELKDYFVNRGVRIQGVVIGMDETPYTNEVCTDSVPVYDLTGSSAATDRIVQGLT